MSLIESIITIAIVLLIMVAISGILVGLYKTYYFGWYQSQAIEEAERGVETMIKEIRKAKRGEDGAYVIEAAEDFQFIFYSDEDGDGETERIRYFVEGNYFKKGVIQPEGVPPVYPPENEKVVVLSQYVINTPPIFRYFDGNFQELPPPARRTDTKLMRLTLEIDVNPSQPPSSFFLISEAQIRNLKTNL